jgi:hypothetical protein
MPCSSKHLEKEFYHNLMHKEVESAYGPEIFEKEPTVQDAQDVVPIRSGDMGVAYVNFEKKL